ncbi:darcynin family protein [Amycolatopsis pithecellobii]|uniref:Darcynin 2 n=1 Tax=Amycolatopsis pithecellobii TaxID=664692 RepID=A0A6N7Z8N4_9PSEU|nr:darcynin family protein [Amycolatopsis pithecellobii]MTD57960.1 Darcynin 2 [Amycolatopsis pithecellobii]
MRYGIIIRYEFSPSWLQLDRAERNAHEEVFQREIVAPFSDKLSIRHFDAEAFATGFSDFFLVTTEDLRAYYYFIEKLRDSSFIANGWARIHDITIGIEDGYKEYERDLG